MNVSIIYRNVLLLNEAFGYELCDNLTICIERNHQRKPLLICIQISHLKLHSKCSA